MLKFKNSTKGNNAPYPLHADQVHGKFSFCFNSSLNYCRNLNSLNFTGKLFHKTLPLKSDEFIPYF